MICLQTETNPGSPKPFQPCHRDSSGHYAAAQKGRDSGSSAGEWEGGAGDSLLQVGPGGFKVSGVLPPILFPSLLPFPGPLLPRHRASVLSPFSVVFSQAWDTLWLKCLPCVFQVSQETC